MAQYYGGVQGNRSEATRLGTKNSGLNAFANGWNVGVDVVLSHDSITGKDHLNVYLTSGSNNQHSRKLLFSGDEDEVRAFLAGRLEAAK